MSRGDTLMPNIEITEDNTAEVLRALSKASIRALETIGGMMEANAKKEITNVVYGTPPGWYRRTGALRNSITHKTDGDSVVVGSNLEYAPYVELGTGKEYSPPPDWIESQAQRGKGRDRWYYKDEEGKWHVGVPQKPRPFLRPAVENYIDKYKEVAENELRKG